MLFKIVPGMQVPFGKGGEDRNNAGGSARACVWRAVASRQLWLGRRAIGRRPSGAGWRPVGNWCQRLGIFRGRRNAQCWLVGREPLIRHAAIQKYSRSAARTQPAVAKTAVSSHAASRGRRVLRVSIERSLLLV